MTRDSSYQRLRCLADVCFVCVVVDYGIHHGKPTWRRFIHKFLKRLLGRRDNNAICHMLLPLSVSILYTDLPD